MLTKKKKFSKKEIKEDKLVTFMYNAQSFYEAYQKTIIVTGIAIVAVAAIAYWYLNQKSSANEQAGIELSRVMKSFDKGAYLEAIEGKAGSNIMGLKKIVEDYGNTENGESAKIYLANAYSYLGNYEEAFKYYKDYSGSIEIFKAASLAGQASYYASKKDYTKAAELYLQAANVTELNAQNPDYLLDASINYIQAGEKEQAKVLLDRIKNDYKASAASREVSKYLALVQ